MPDERVIRVDCINVNDLIDLKFDPQRVDGSEESEKDGNDDERCEFERVLESSLGARFLKTSGYEDIDEPEKCNL